MNAYELEPYVKALAFSPDGLELAVGADEGSVTVLDAETGAVRRVLPALSEVIGGLAWLSTGNSIVVASREGALRWIDATTGDTMGELALPDERFLCHDKGRPGPSPPCISVSADGARLAVAGELPPSESAVGSDGQVAGVAVWDIASGRRLGVYRIDSGWIGGIALDSTGDRLAALVRKRRYESKERDGLVVWNVANGERIMDRAYERASLYSLLFSPEGNRIVVGGDDGKVRFLDTEGDLQDVVLEMGNLGVLSLLLASDGSKIVVGTKEELILLETGPPPGGWAARARASEARGLVDGLFHDLKFAEDVTARLRENADLPEEIRLATLDLVRIRGDHHGWLNIDAIFGSRATSLTEKELQLVLRKAELANRLWSGYPPYVATLGKCQFRAGDYLEALKNLDRAAELYRASRRGLAPEDLAYVAMARWRLGERETARQTMQDLESLLANRSDALGSGALASIEEARTLIVTVR